LSYVGGISKFTVAYSQKSTLFIITTLPIKVNAF